MNLLGFSRRHWRRFLQFAGLFGLCMALVVGCGAPQQDASAPSDAGDEAVEDATSGGRVSMGTTLKARTLDPADSYEIFPGILLYNMGDRLYTYEPGSTDLVPQLATELPTVSEDGLTYTMPLREGITFHDGTPFTAEAMAFSIQRFMENGGRPAFLLAEKINTVEATGDLELTITLNSPFAAFPALLTFWGVTPVPPESYEIAAGSFQPDTFVGTGPYMLSSFTTDSIKLDANPDYWGEAPANEGIDIQLFTSPANLFNAFQTGDIDVAYQTLDPDQIANLEQNAEQNEWTVVEAGTTVVNYMSLNLKMEPMDQLEVRQAIAAMMDRTLIRDRVFQGQAEPLYSMIPIAFDVYEPVFEDAYGDGNYELARELLASAGFDESNPFTLELWYPSASTTRSIVANTLKESIENALPGIVTVDVQNVEGATLFENMEKGIYPAVLQNWYPDFFDVDNFVQPFLSCDEGNPETLCESGATFSDGTFYYSEAANELIQQQRAEQDPTARNAILADIQQLMVDDVPSVPLWQNKDYVFAQSGIEGVAIQPTQQFLLWQIEK